MLLSHPMIMVNETSRGDLYKLAKAKLERTLILLGHSSFGEVIEEMYIIFLISLQ